MHLRAQALAECDKPEGVAARGSRRQSQVKLLLEHYKTLLSYLGGDATKVQREWRRLKLFIARDPILFDLDYVELYERLFDQYSDKFLYDGQRKVTTSKLNDQSFYNILVLAAIVQCIAVDTSICERGFSLMNNLKTARRTRMRNLLLRTLMTIPALLAQSGRIQLRFLWRQSWRSGGVAGSKCKGTLRVCHMEGSRLAGAVQQDRQVLRRSR